MRNTTTTTVALICTPSATLDTTTTHSYIHRAKQLHTAARSESARVSPLFIDASVQGRCFEVRPPCSIPPRAPPTSDNKACRDRQSKYLPVNRLPSTTIQLRATFKHTAPTTLLYECKGYETGLTSRLRIERFTRALLEHSFHLHLHDITKTHCYTNLQHATEPAFSRLPRLNLRQVTDTGREDEVLSRRAGRAQAITAGEETRWAAVNPTMDGCARRPEQ